MEPPTPGLTWITMALRAVATSTSLAEVMYRSLKSLFSSWLVASRSKMACAACRPSPRVQGCARRPAPALPPALLSSQASRPCTWATESSKSSGSAPFSLAIFLRAENMVLQGRPGISDRATPASGGVRRGQLLQAPGPAEAPRSPEGLALRPDRRPPFCWPHVGCARALRSLLVCGRLCFDEQPPWRATQQAQQVLQLFGASGTPEGLPALGPALPYSLSGSALRLGSGLYWTSGSCRGRALSGCQGPEPLPRAPGAAAARQQGQAPRRQLTAGTAVAQPAACRRPLAAARSSCVTRHLRERGQKMLPD